MKYTKEKADKIYRLVKSGVTHKGAAQAEGIDESTLYRWVDRYASFANLIKKADGEAEARNVLIIEKAAVTTWQAAAWWLERRRRGDYATRKELTGAEGEKIEIVVKDYEEQPTKGSKTHKKAKTIPKGNK